MVKSSLALNQVRYSKVMDQIVKIYQQFRNGDSEVALSTMTVVLSNSKDNASIYDKSTKSFVNVDVASQLGFQGTIQKLNGNLETPYVMPVELHVKSWMEL